MNHADICAAIYNGGFTSEQLDAILQAITCCRDNKQLKLRRQLTVGQTVWFNDTTHPKYLIGEELTILKINRERIVVKMKNGAQGRFSGSGIRTSLNLITTIKPPYAAPVLTQAPDRMYINKSDVGVMPPEILGRD